MQTARIVQAVVLMTIVAVAASCAASKEYTSKLFAPRNPVVQDSPAVAALRFLEFDKTDEDKAGWVTTDIIMGRDTLNTTALDKFAETFPASSVTGNTAKQVQPVTANKIITAKEDTAIAKKSIKSTTSKPVSEIVEAKPEPVESEPVARNINTEEVRTKRTREK